MNTLLTRTHEASTTIRQPLTPLLTSHIYPLFQPSEINDYSLSPHLFLRNTEEGEKALANRTVEAYEEVILSYDNNGYVVLLLVFTRIVTDAQCRNWRPSYLPHAKPLQEIMHAMHRYVQSVASASRRLKRAFPESREPENGQPASVPPRVENPVSSERPPGDRTEKGAANAKSTQTERKSSSRRREESRATRAVLAFFGEYDEPAPVDKGKGADVGILKNRAVDAAAAIQVEVVAGVESEVRLRRGSRDRSPSVSARREVDIKATEQDVTRERSAMSTVKVPPQSTIKSDDPFTARPPKRKRMSMPGYDIIERRVRERSRMLSETPAPEWDAVSRRSGSVAPEHSSRIRRASMGPQVGERTPGPVRDGWVPSPGMRFQMDAEGRLVYIGMAEGSSPAAKTPEVTMKSLQKVKEAAAATRGTPGGSAESPAGQGRSGRGFAKPLIPVGGVKVEEDVARDAQREGGSQRQAKVVARGNAPSRLSTPTNGPPVRTVSQPHAQTESRLDEPSSTTKRDTTTRSASASHRIGTSTTTTPTPRKRLAPFEDATVQRVPPGYRPGGRRLSSSEVAAAAFSKARREGSGRR